MTKQQVLERIMHLRHFYATDILATYQKAKDRMYWAGFVIDEMCNARSWHPKDPDVVREFEDFCSYLNAEHTKYCAIVRAEIEAEHAKNPPPPRVRPLFPPPLTREQWAQMVKRNSEIAEAEKEAKTQPFFN